MQSLFVCEGGFTRPRGTPRWGSVSPSAPPEPLRCRAMGRAPSDDACWERWEAFRVTDITLLRWGTPQHDTSRATV